MAKLCCTQQSSLPVGGRSDLEPKVEIRTSCTHNDFFLLFFTTCGKTWTVNEYVIPCMDQWKTHQHNFLQLCRNPGADTAGTVTSNWSRTAVHLELHRIIHIDINWDWVSNNYWYGGFKTVNKILQLLKGQALIWITTLPVLSSPIVLRSEVVFV